MSTPQTKLTPKPGFWSLRRVIASTMGLAIVGAIILVAGLSIYQTNAIIRTQFEKSATDITDLFGANLGGAVKFGKTEILDARFEELITSQSGMVSAAAAFKPDGSEIGEGAGQFAGMEDLAKASIESGEPVASPDGYVRAVPVIFGKNNDIVGAVVVAWNDDRLEADVERISLYLAQLGLLVALACSVLAALVLGPLMSGPLRRLTVAVGQLAEGGEDPLHETARRDEIGGLARALRAVHEQGLSAQRIRSALDGSSV
ncbi:MAG: HAMP domain-containing protein, partial [Pseudomonadota bacterium]